MSDSVNQIRYEQFDPEEDSLSRLAELIEAERVSRGRSHFYYVNTFGCQQNENDSEKIKGILEAAGYLPSDSYENADLVLINTCSIRENADQRLFGHLGFLKTLREKKPGLICGVCGCLPTQEEQAAKIKRSYSFVQLLFGPADIGRLPRLLLRVLEGEKRAYGISRENTVTEGMPILRERKFRALVSIMYGCNNFCTYCMVPFARGRERSRKAEDILAECRQVAAAGIPEVMLLGQNVNAWGFDLFSRRKNAAAGLDCSPEASRNLEAIREGGQREIVSFAQLLTAIAAIPGIETVRYMSSHPRDFDGELIRALELSPEIENHLHLPMQSGSDSVLRRMNRHYDCERFREIVRRVRMVRPALSLTTDIIVGFPGEREEDFADTLRLVEEMKFESAFTFIYSPRPGTPAAAWEQLPSAIQHERFDRLLEVQNRLSLQAHQSILGTERRLLIEGISRGDSEVLTGRDSEFHLINVTIRDGFASAEPLRGRDGRLNEKEWEGRYVTARITEAKTYSLEAELLSVCSRVPKGEVR